MAQPSDDPGKRRRMLSSFLLLVLIGVLAYAGLIIKVAWFGP